MAKAPIRPLNNWILSKIKDYLSAKEGCDVEDVEYTETGARTIVQDAMGFRYEVTIKAIGRSDSGGTYGFTSTVAVTKEVGKNG